MTRRGIRVICNELEIKLTSEIDTKALTEACASLVEGYANSDFSWILRTISDLYISTSNAMDIDCNESAISHRGVERHELLSEWDVAFKQPYKNRAFDSFLEYLDIQWAKVCKSWAIKDDTMHSFCATIIQSSCAGKSRLVQRFVLLSCF
jgi:hypothetical protein